MKVMKIGLALIALVVVQACGDRETYPVSQQVCTAEDPVLDLTANNCGVPR